MLLWLINLGFAGGGGGGAISPGDLVQVMIAPIGIECCVKTSTGTAVRVVTESSVKIYVTIESGTPIRVTI